MTTLPPLPDHIGPYSVERLIGEGGFGRVYAGRGPAGLVAIKVAHRRANELSSPELVLQENELETLTRLRHPSVVRVHTHGYTDQGQLYIAMELLHGESLESILQRRTRLDTVEVLGIVGKVAEALAYCHGQGIAHLDLKPDNIIVVDPHIPLIKILDFGLARMGRSGQGELISIVGTPLYMPPERFNSPALDPRADLYALGVILYETLTGDPPFLDGPVERMIQAKNAGVLTPLSSRAPSVPDVLSDLVNRMLDPDPSRRPGSAEEITRILRNTFHTAVGGSPESAPHPILSETTVHHLGPVPFVGRSEALKDLRSAFVASKEAGQAVILVGPPGMGKSRMVTRLIQRAPGRHALTAYGRCRELGGLVPFAPFREALGQLATHLVHRSATLLAGVREALAHDAAAAADLVPELRELLDQPNDADLDDHPPLPQALIALLRAVAASSPVIVVIEDLQWADDAVLDMITTLGLAPPPGLLLLATSRTDPQLPGMVPITLSPLSEADNDHLIGSLANIHDQPIIELLKQHIPLLRRGNPMVATQVVHDLYAQRVLMSQPNGQVSIDEQALESYRPPDSIQDVLHRAVSQLSTESRAVLSIAAMMGRRFSIDTLGKIGTLSPAKVASALAEAERLGILRADKKRGEFTHDAVCTELSEQASDEERITVHKHIARALRRTGAAPGTLAHHLERSGDNIGAALAYLKAGHHAEDLHDPAGADVHLRRALDLAGDLPPSAVRSEVLRQGALSLVRNASGLGATEDLLAYLERCEDRLGEGRHDVAAMSSAFARLYYVKGDFVRAVEHSKITLDTAGDDPELAPYRIVPVNILGRTLCASGHFGMAARTLGEGCDLAREAGDKIELSHSLGMLGLSLGFTGDFTKARQYAEMGARIAWAVNDPVRKIAAMFYASVVGEYAYDFEHGMAHAAEALRLAEEHQLRGLYLYLSMMFSGRHQFHIGELERAGALLQQTLHLSRQYDVAMGLGWAHGFLGDVFFVLGELQSAWHHYEAGAAAAERGAGDAYATGLCLMGRAAVIAEWDGPIDKMRSDAEHALETLENSENRSALAFSLQRFSEALEAFGDPRAGIMMEQCHEAFAALDLPWVDWWPKPPPGVPAFSSHREHWRAIRSDPVDPHAQEFEERATLAFDPERTVGTPKPFDPNDDENPEDEPTVQRPYKRLTEALVNNTQERIGSRPLVGGQRFSE